MTHRATAARSSESRRTLITCAARHALVAHHEHRRHFPRAPPGEGDVAARAQQEVPGVRQLPRLGERGGGAGGAPGAHQGPRGVRVRDGEGAHADRHERPPGRRLRADEQGDRGGDGAHARGHRAADGAAAAGAHGARAEGAVRGARAADQAVPAARADAAGDRGARGRDRPLEEDGKGIASKLELRSKQFAAFMHSVHDLQLSLAEEEQTKAGAMDTS